MSRSRNVQNQRRKTEMLPKKPVGIKLVFDHTHDDSHGTAVVHVFSNALALAFNLLDMLPNMVCYTPALEYPGVYTDYELMDAATDIDKASGANNFATAEHFIVCNGNDGGVYIFMIQGASGPTLHQSEAELIAPMRIGFLCPFSPLVTRWKYTEKDASITNHVLSLILPCRRNARTTLNNSVSETASINGWPGCDVPLPWRVVIVT